MHVWWDEKVCFWEGMCGKWEDVCVVSHGEMGRGVYVCVWSW